MRPVDPRLLRHARDTRVLLAAATALGLAGAVLLVVQATLVAGIVVDAFQRHQGVSRLGGATALLGAVFLGRAAIEWLTERVAHRSGAAVKSTLRRALLERAARPGPGRPTARNTGELTTLAVRGLDALDDYFARYLPHLALAVVVPAVVLIRIAAADWRSALVVVVTLPLIPVFMALIGRYTEARVTRQWRLLSRLSGHFLDVVTGLPTLKVFGRAGAQARSVRRVTDAYRRATLATLRVAFLSSFALELLATLSVALVAVGIGFRVVDGGLDLRTGLVVLLLAPEAYLPVRQVGARFHAAAEGLAAADEVFAVLEAERPAAGTLAAPDPRTATLEVDGPVVRHAGRARPTPAGPRFTVSPGETVAVTGPSGVGKTTLLAVLLGLVRPDSGRVRIDGTDLTSLDLDSWWHRIAWVPQHPHLFAGTVAENLRLARPDATDEQVVRALGDAGALDFVNSLPRGTDTRLGEDGAGLSAGQRQRLALARAFLADRPLLLLDEPTAGLDAATEAAVTDAVRRLARDRTVVLVAHRPALLALADRVVRLEHAEPAAAECGRGSGGRPGAGAAGGGAGEGADGAGPAPGAGATGLAAGVRGAPPAPEATGAEAADAAAGGAAGGGAAAGGAAGGGAAGGGAAGGGAAGGGGRLPGRGRSPLARVRRLARPLRGRFVLALLLAAAASACAVGLMAVAGWLISRAAQHPPVLALLVAATATRAFGIGRAAFRYAERLVAHDAVLRALADLRAAVVRRLARLAPAGPHGVRRGELLSRLVADVDAVQEYFLRWLLPVAAAGLVGVVCAGFLCWVLPVAGAVLATGLLAAGVGVPVLTGWLSRRAEAGLAPARGRLSTAVVELFSGTAESAVAGASGRRLGEVALADAALTRLAARSAGTAALGSALVTLVTGATVAGAALAGAAAVAAGTLPGVAVAVVVLTPLAAFEAVGGIPAAVRYRQRARECARRVQDVLDAPVRVREPERPADRPAVPFPLTLDAVGVRHPGARRPALDGVSLRLDAGRRIAVVGASGAGKSTLAHTLLRFVAPEAGGYRLGGVPAERLGGERVREVVGLCAQDAHVFDSTLRENLRLARPGADDGQLRAALADARLLDWVDGLPAGLDTLVGEHGARISGGQRQRLALARALLAGFPVLVLDEPAEHLDLPTADALTADLLRATAGRATVLITHRLAMLAAPGAVDEIVVLDAGRVAQRGDFARLAAEPGPFRRLLETERAADAVRAGHVPWTAGPGTADPVGPGTVGAATGAGAR